MREGFDYNSGMAFILFILWLLAVASGGGSPAAHRGGAPGLPARRHLQWRVESASHPSGIYFPGQSGVARIVVTNRTAKPQPLRGPVRLVYRTPAGRTTVVSITPVTATQIGPRHRVALLIPMHFALPGSYALCVRDQVLECRYGIHLCCQYRAGPGALGAAAPWIQSLPPAFKAPGADAVVGDFIARTGIRRFVWRTRWPVKHARAAPANGAIGRRLKLLRLPSAIWAARLQGCGGKVVWVVRVAKGSLRRASAAPLEFYLRRRLATMGAACAAVALELPGPIDCGKGAHAGGRRQHGAATGRRGRRAAWRLYRAARRAVDATNARTGTNIKLLILPRMAEMIRRHLAAIHPAAPGAPVATAGIPAFRMMEDRRRTRQIWPNSSLAAAAELRGSTGKNPPRYWILPIKSKIRKSRGGERKYPRGLSLALLAQGAAVAPVTPGGNGAVRRHMRSPLRWVGRVRASVPPVLGVFQARGIAVAVIAGLGARTTEDCRWSALRYVTHTRLKPQFRHRIVKKRLGAGKGAGSVGGKAAATTGSSRKKVVPSPIKLPNKFPRGWLHVDDPQHALHVRSLGGSPIAARQGDDLRIPLTGQVWLVYTRRPASHLLALLRTSVVHGYPWVCFTARRRRGGRHILLTLRNAHGVRVHPALSGRFMNAAGKSIGKAWRAAAAPLKPGQAEVIKITIPRRAAAATGLLVRCRMTGARDVARIPITH